MTAHDTTTITVHGLNSAVEQRLVDEFGARAWSSRNGRAHRLYINGWAALIGLETSRYGSGNISSATLNGERISNSEAKRLLGAVDSVWVEDGQVYYRAWDSRGADAAQSVQDAINRIGVDQ